MKIHYRVAGAVVTLLAVSSPCGVVADEDVRLTEVPATAIAAAEAAVAGLTISSAEVEVERGQTVYELEGSANGVEYEVEVTADGEVLEVEIDD